jgi:hypothetical protein
MLHDMAGLIRRPSEDPLSTFYGKPYKRLPYGLALTKSLPEGAMFLPKPWLALDVLREADRSHH